MERVGGERKAALGFGVVLVWALVSLVSAVILVFTGFDVGQISSGVQGLPQEAVEGAVTTAQDRRADHLRALPHLCGGPWSRW